MNKDYEREIINQRRRLQRYVNFQINKLSQNNPSSVITIDENSIIRSSDIKIEELIRSQEDGVFERHQFQDAKSDITPNGYNKWLNRELKGSYFNTINASSIFNADNNQIATILSQHSSEEVNNEAFYGYSIYKILKSLHYLDPFLIFRLMCNGITFVKVGYYDYILGNLKLPNGKSRTIAANFITKDLYYQDSHGDLILWMNIYEFLFKYYHIPVFELMNSVNEVVDHYLCPEEGLGNYKVNKELQDKVEKITSTREYQRVRKEKVTPFKY